MTMTKQNVSRPGSQYKQWVISKDGVPVGVVEKYPNTKSEVHPIKVFKGVPASELIAFVYKASALAKMGVSNDKIVDMVENQKGYAPTKLGGMKEAMALLA